MSEKEIMEEANCDFIVKLYKTFKDRRHLYMVQQQNKISIEFHFFL